MNSVARFFREFAESRRIEGQLRRKLSELEIKRLNHSSNELQWDMTNLDNLAWRARLFNKGKFFCEDKIPSAVNFIDMRNYNFRIDSLKRNIGCQYSNYQNI